MFMVRCRVIFDPQGWTLIWFGMGRGRRGCLSCGAAQLPQDLRPTLAESDTLTLHTSRIIEATNFAMRPDFVSFVSMPSWHCMVAGMSHLSAFRPLTDVEIERRKRLQVEVKWLWSRYVT